MTRGNQPRSTLQAIICVLTLLLYYVKLSTSSPVENDNDQLLWLRVQVTGFKNKLDQLVIKLEEEAILRGHFQTLKSELETKVTQLTTENVKQAQRLDVLEASFLPFEGNRHIINRRHNPDNNKQHKDQEKSSIHAAKESQHSKCDISSLRLPPTSCRQLAFIGHRLNAIYLIANPHTNKVETVYCDFTGTNLSETLYGNVALTTKSVHFNVQRNKSFDLNNVFLPFDIERLNEGGAMNLATGVFTVPVDGIYHFEFSGLKEPIAVHFAVDLQVNGVSISTAYATGLSNYLAVNGISASLRLKVGDQVGLYKTSGSLHDSSLQYTHFSGWLVEEDLAFF